MSQHEIHSNFVSWVMKHGSCSKKCKYIKLLLLIILKHKDNIYFKTNNFVHLPIKVFLLAKQLLINCSRM